MTTKRLDRAYMVTRTDNHGGFSVRATSAEEAARKAMRYDTMQGAGEVEVRSICGPPVCETIKVG